MAKRRTGIRTCVDGYSLAEHVIPHELNIGKSDMAAEKMNQAFIKAYGKRKLMQGSDSSEPQESLLVRFDTATVHASIPQMHAPRPPRQSVTPRSPAARPVSPAKAKECLQHTASQAGKEPIHESLSSSGQQSGCWESAASLLISSDDWTSVWGSSTMIVPQANLGRSSENPSGTELSTKSTVDSPSVMPQESQSQPPPCPAPDPQCKADGEPMEAEADSRTETPKQPRSPDGETDDTDVNGKSTIRWRIGARKREGGIFRIDHPESGTASASKATSAGGGETKEKNSTTSKPDRVDLYHQPADFQDQKTVSGKTVSGAEADSFDSGPHREKILAAEQGLRRARKRIFNPLWEVDRLDWPRICLELTAKVQERSPGVARNLSHASEEGLQVLAVTSPISGAGTSTVACCLAMLAGMHGMNIALVDGNLESPSLCYQTNLEIEQDWADAVSKRLPLEEIAIHSIDDQITMLPLLSRLNTPRLTEHNVATALQELSQSFDLVIVDLGPINSSGNMVSSLGMLGVLNAVVTVIDRRDSNTGNLESCLRQIRTAGIASIGLVENFAA